MSLGIRFFYEVSNYKNPNKFFINVFSNCDRKSPLFQIKGDAELFKKLFFQCRIINDPNYANNREGEESDDEDIPRNISAYVPINNNNLNIWSWVKKEGGSEVSVCHYKEGLSHYYLFSLKTAESTIIFKQKDNLYDDVTQRHTFMYYLASEEHGGKLVDDANEMTVDISLLENYVKITDYERKIHEEYLSYQ